jgi:hypothetical protein
VAATSAKQRKGNQLKINFGDISIVIEPGDDPRQVIEIADAIGRRSEAVCSTLNDAAVSVAGVLVGEAEPDPDPLPRKRIKRCAGKDVCDGLYHYSETKRHYVYMCETYEYVASYKHGRKSSQVAQWCGLSTSAAYHRLETLVGLGLLVRAEGRVYVAAS